MKKALPIVVLLLVVAAVVGSVAWWRTAGARPHFPASRAAELAPAETVVLLEISDVPRAVERQFQNRLSLSASEAWGRDFVKTMFSAEPYGLNGILEMLRAVKDVEPEGFFLASTDLNERPFPKMVGGFPYRGRKSEVKQAVHGLKERLLAAQPGVKSELSKHRQVEIESFTSPTPSQRWPIFEVACELGSYWQAPIPPDRLGYLSVHLAFVDDWLLVANDRTLLAGTLDRYLGQPGAGKGLAGEADFATGHAPWAVGIDVAVWGRWEPVRRQVLAEVETLRLGGANTILYPLVIQDILPRDGK